MKHLAFTSLIVMTAVSWGGPKDPFSGTPIAAPQLHSPASYEKMEKEDQERWRSWLKIIGEPDLESLLVSPGLEVYRFSYLPPFSKALVLTARKQGGELSFQIQRFSVKRDLELKGAVELDDRMFEGIREALSKPEVSAPLANLTPEQRMFQAGLDGAWWHLETLRDGKYTHASVWSPETYLSQTQQERGHFRKEVGIDLPDLRPFVVACIEFVRLSGLPMDATNYEPFPLVKEP